MPRWSEGIPGDLGARVGRLLGVKGSVTEGFDLTSDVIPVVVVNELDIAAAVVAQRNAFNTATLTAVNDAVFIIVADRESWSIEGFSYGHDSGTVAILDRFMIARAGVNILIGTNPEDPIPSAQESSVLKMLPVPFLLNEGDSFNVIRRAGVEARITQLSVFYRIVTP